MATGTKCCSQGKFDKFKELAQDLEQTLLIVTQDQEFAICTDRILQMEDGRVVI